MVHAFDVSGLILQNHKTGQNLEDIPAGNKEAGQEIGTKSRT